MHETTGDNDTPARGDTSTDHRPNELPQVDLEDCDIRVVIPEMAPGEQ